MQIIICRIQRNDKEVNMKNHFPAKINCRLVLGLSRQREVFYNVAKQLVVDGT
jgi:hypothetical protein